MLEATARRLYYFSASWSKGQRKWPPHTIANCCSLLNKYTQNWNVVRGLLERPLYLLWCVRWRQEQWQVACTCVYRIPYNFHRPYKMQLYRHTGRTEPKTYIYISFYVPSLRFELRGGDQHPSSGIFTQYAAPMMLSSHHISHTLFSG